MISKPQLEDNDYELVHSIIEKELSAINLNIETKQTEKKSKYTNALIFSSKESCRGNKESCSKSFGNCKENNRHYDNYFNLGDDDKSSSKNSKTCSSNSLNTKQISLKHMISHSCKISFPISLHDHLDDEQALMLMKNKSLSNFLNSVDVLISKPLSSNIYYQYFSSNILTISSTIEGLNFFTKKLKVTPYTIIKCILNEVRQ